MGYIEYWSVNVGECSDGSELMLEDQYIVQGLTIVLAYALLFIVFIMLTSVTVTLRVRLHSGD